MIPQRLDGQMICCNAMIPEGRVEDKRDSWRNESDIRTGVFHLARLRAAHSTWGQSLREYVCVDRSAAMLGLAEKLLKGEPSCNPGLSKAKGGEGSVSLGH